MFTTSQLLIICGLTFIIHLVGTLAYAARIAGVRTRRVAVSPQKTFAAHAKLATAPLWLAIITAAPQ